MDKIDKRKGRKESDEMSMSTTSTPRGRGRGRGSRGGPSGTGGRGRGKSRDSSSPDPISRGAKNQSKSLGNLDLLDAELEPIPKGVYSDEDDDDDLNAGTQTQGDGVGGGGGGQQKEDDRKEEEEEEEEEEDEDMVWVPQSDESNAAIRHILENMSEEETRRYEIYRRSHLPKAAVKKYVQSQIGAVPAQVPIIVAGAGKLFVGDIVENAKEVMRDWGHTGAIRPEHVREAYRRYRMEHNVTSPLHKKSLFL